MLGEHLRAGRELLGAPKGLDSFAMLSVGYDFDQALLHKPLETSWTDASAVQVNSLLNGCEQAIQNIQEEVLQATKVQRLGEIANKSNGGP